MPIRVAVLMFHGVEVLDFAGPFEVFGVCGWNQPRPPFDVFTVSAQLPHVTARGGLRVEIDYPADFPRPDILVVPGGFGTRRERHNRAVLDLVRDAAAGGATVLTVCTGSLVAADAGLLDGRHATTHRAALAELAQCSASITVHEGARIVDNGDVVCSTGISAGIDAALYVAARFTSPREAQETADYMHYEWQHREPDGVTIVRPLTRFLPLLVLPAGETMRRIPRVCVGLVLFGVGIAMMVRGDLGLGPWDVLHQGLSDRTGLGIGVVIVGVGALILVGFIPLGERIGLGTVLNAVLIGATVDVVLAVFDRPDQVGARVALTFGGPIVIAVGSGFYIGGGLGPGPRDGIMTGLARRGMKVSHARTAIEVTVLATGIALGGSVGIGTLWFAVSIGPLVGVFLPRLSISAHST